MSGTINKLRLYGLLEGLGDAARRDGRDAAQHCREQLSLTVHGLPSDHLDKELANAVKHAFTVSGPWVRGIDPAARTVTQKAVEVAIAVCR